MDAEPITPRSCAQLLTRTLPAIMRSIVGSIRRRNGEHHDGQTMDQSHLLEMIDEGITSLRDLADIHRVTPSTMSRSIDVLVRKGWVSREADPGDRRQVRLTVTDEGRVARAAVHRLVEDEMVAVLARLDPDQLARVYDGLQALSTLVPDVPEPAPLHTGIAAKLRVATWRLTKQAPPEGESRSRAGR